jgi:hypothetical protein
LHLDLAGGLRHYPARKGEQHLQQTGALSDFGRTGRYNDTVESSNWSGYAVEEPSGTKFTEVIGSWVQPAVSCPSRTAQYSSFWAGIDDYSKQLR